MKTYIPLERAVKIATGYSGHVNSLRKKIRDGGVWVDGTQECNPFELLEEGQGVILNGELGSVEFTVTRRMVREHGE